MKVWSAGSAMMFRTEEASICLCTQVLQSIPEKAARCCTFKELKTALILVWANIVARTCSTLSLRAFDSCCCACVSLPAWAQHHINNDTRPCAGGKWHGLNQSWQHSLCPCANMLERSLPTLRAAAISLLRALNCMLSIWRSFPTAWQE